MKSILNEDFDVCSGYEYFGLWPPVIYPKPNQLQTFLSLLETTTTRKKVFDVALAATLRDNHVDGLYTVNVDDFKGSPFLKVENPLA